MYSIGLGYGFAGKHNLEKAYYILAAAEEVPAAYLALGNIYRESDMDQAIAWYVRFANTKSEGYGYGAYMLSGIYQKLEQPEKASYWLSVCIESSMGADCVK
ncbi:hypothetical protein Sde_0447 [Saccharophagus degradans 2-40]|uniref:Sel1 repeat family protein n=2 Tax=Saccharophagus degradans TaxID=86304 RepID=Q21NL8_SACD2|nr:hypothetical protein Sde_0447 [Saccharophagus degradans 2-40]